MVAESASRPVVLIPVAPMSIEVLPTERTVPSNVKLPSSSSSPLAPAMVTLLLVKSVTFNVPIVALSAASSSAFTVPSK